MTPQLPNRVPHVLVLERRRLAQQPSPQCTVSWPMVDVSSSTTSGGNGSTNRRADGSIPNSRGMTGRGPQRRNVARSPSGSTIGETTMPTSIDPTRCLRCSETDSPTAISQTVRTSRRSTSIEMPKSDVSNGPSSPMARSELLDFDSSGNQIGTAKQHVSFRSNARFTGGFSRLIRARKRAQQPRSAIRGFRLRPLRSGHPNVTFVGSFIN